MRIAEVIGTVTLIRAHPNLTHPRLKLAIPLSLDNLLSHQPLGLESLVVYDELGAGIGSRILLSEGGEASRPFHPDAKPIDAYNSGILDEIEIR